MPAEAESLASLLKSILAKDRSLLGRKDDLLPILDAQVSGAQMRDYRSLEKALRVSNVGDMFLAADNQDREVQDQVRTEAAKTLLLLGMQERAVTRVLDTLAEALGWNDKSVVSKVTPEIIEIETARIENVQENEVQNIFLTELEKKERNTLPQPQISETWRCRCGHDGNKGNFCVACGTLRSEGEVTAEAFWDCLCGKKDNHGNFCVACGRSRAEGEVAANTPVVITDTWACRCGKRGNKGNFCTACGCPRAEGEVDLWNCICGHKNNTGNFCIACGRSKDQQ